MNKQATPWDKYTHTRHLHPDYINNSFNSKVFLKIQWEIMGRRLEQTLHKGRSTMAEKGT